MKKLPVRLYHDLEDVDWAVEVSKDATDEVDDSRRLDPSTVPLPLSLSKQYTFKGGVFNLSVAPLLRYDDGGMGCSASSMSGCLGRGGNTCRLSGSSLCIDEYGKQVPPAHRML